MYRSNVIVIAPSTPTEAVPAGGETEATTGAPTVVKSMSPGEPCELPAMSWTPGPTRTWNFVESGSLVDGVKIIVRPFQWNDPVTFGVIANACSAVSFFTFSLKSTSTEVSRGDCPAAVTAEETWILKVGGMRSTKIALKMIAARTKPAMRAETSRRKRPLLSQPKRFDASTGQDDSTAPILANL